MARIPSIKEQLAEVQEELDIEQKRWIEAGIGDVGGIWRAGNLEFAFRCEALTIIEILKEKFELTQEELDLRFKRVVLAQLKALYPGYAEAAKEARRAAIVNGVRPRPPRDFQ